ncbi:hypothetical protein CIB48_g3653 [Xylaria polymorpha]|nr:hypothetical protein CIB48_g3653 [Xylaria polymorpha]
MTALDESTPDFGYRKPKTRQRIHKEPPTLTVPDINNDATERKRVLNVLAQRRYRERKRQAKGRGRAENATSSPQPDNTRNNEPGAPVGLDASVSETPVLENEPSFSTYLNLSPPPDSTSASSSFNSDVQESCFGTGNPSWPALQVGASVTGSIVTALDFLDTLDLSALFDSSSTAPSASDDPETTDISFPDSYYLPVHELALLRGLRAILLLGLPDNARPPAAAGPSYDLEDNAEGARIWGDDPYEPTSWEVGQVLFERWWFVFDREVINQSNYLHLPSRYQLLIIFAELQWTAAAVQERSRTSRIKEI